MDFINELKRKAFHQLILLVPLLYHFAGKWKTLLIITPLALAVIGIDFLRQKNPKINQIFGKIFGKILRPEELGGEKLCGASWFLLAACITVFLFKGSFVITAFCILAISDALASLVGRSIPSDPFFEKSFSGSLTFFISALIILFICGGFFHVGLWFYFIGLFAVFCVTMFEARPSLFNLDDNFIIPVGFCVIMTFFDLVWNYNY